MLSHIVRLSKKGQMVVPREIRKALGVRPGDHLLIVFREGEAVLIHPNRYAQFTSGLLKGTWGKTREEVDSYLRGEREAWDRD